MVSVILPIISVISLKEFWEHFSQQSCCDLYRNYFSKQLYRSVIFVLAMVCLPHESADGARPHAGLFAGRLS